MFLSAAPVDVAESESSYEWSDVARVVELEIQ